jgi:hypothetical protein
MLARVGLIMALVMAMGTPDVDRALIPRDDLRQIGAPRH